MPMIQAEMSKADQCNRRLSIKIPKNISGFFYFTTSALEFFSISAS